MTTNDFRKLALDSPGAIDAQHRSPCFAAAANHSYLEPSGQQQRSATLDRDERLEGESGVLDQSRHHQLVRTVRPEQQLPQWR